MGFGTELAPFAAGLDCGSTTGTKAPASITDCDSPGTDVVAASAPGEFFGRSFGSGAFASSVFDSADLFDVAFAGTVKPLGVAETGATNGGDR